MVSLVRAAAVIGVVVVVVALSGCTADEESPMPSPSETAAADPVFANEEEALAAATEAYAEYLRVSDEILAAGGEGPERIDPHVTSEYGDAEMAGFEAFRDSASFSDGNTTFDSVRLQEPGDAILVGDTMTAYLCTDVSQVRIVDSARVDVTPIDRPNRIPLEVDFYVADGSPIELLISRSDVWSGADFC